MKAKTRTKLRLAVVALGVFFLVANLLIDGVSPWDLIPLAGMAMGLVAIELARRDQDRGL